MCVPTGKQSWRRCLNPVILASAIAALRQGIGTTRNMPAKGFCVFIDPFIWANRATLSLV